MANWYLGTDLKFLVEMTAQGFSMDNNDWEVSVMCGTKTVSTFGKQDCIRDDDGNWYVCIKATLLKKGDLTLVAHALVPDTDFEDDIRNEVDKEKVGKILK